MVLLSIILIAMILFMFRQHANMIKITQRLDKLSNKITDLESKTNLDTPTSVRTDETNIPEVIPTAPEQTLEINEKEKPWVSKKNQTSTKSTKSFFKNIEKELSTRWMIWLGGVAFAIGGLFLVKYSIDVGLLRPAVRVTLGTLIGIIMALGGEAIRQRRIKANFLSDVPDYVPSAISAAGIFTAFAAIYSSYAIYQLISPMVAFVGLTLLSFLSTAIAYYQGRFFALLGMIGGFVIPALVSTDTGNAWALFPYLLLISAATLWVSRQRAWTVIAGITLLFAMLWPVIWIFSNWSVGDVIPVGAYLIILSALNASLLSGATIERSSEMTLKGLIPKHPVTFISDSAAILAIILLVSIVRIEHYSAVAFTLFTMALLGQAYAVHKHSENDAGGIFAIGGILFLLSTWHVPNLIEIEALLSEPTTRTFIWSPIAPPGLQTFTTACLSFGIIISAAIFTRLKHLSRPALWASIGNLLPIAIMVIAYWRIYDLETSTPFGIIAIIVAVLLTLCTKIIRDTLGSDNQTVLAAYAAGATTAVALGISFVLREAWLSFALAMELVALGYIWQKTAVRGLRYLALILAAVVLVRLFLNAAIFDYQPGPLPLLNWLFYGYGLTAGMFYAASKIFTESKNNDRLMTTLKAGWIILLISFVTLEIRALFSDENTLSSDPSDLEIALQSLNWSIATVILMWREIKDNDALLGILRRVMTVVSLLGLFIGGGIANNIFFGTIDPGPFSVLNLQFLQIFIPSLLYGFKAYLARLSGKTKSLKLYSAVAFFGIWFWISAEVRHFFHPNGGHSPESNWEIYSYSLVWILYAIAVLVVGLKRRNETIRLAGLGVLSVVVLKVFLSDMSALEGLARALSFMGLGGALIGIGYLYQKLKTDEGK